MTNQELLQKMKEDMEMRGFSHWTKESYDLKDTDFAPENYLELETKRSAGKINRTSYFYTFDSV